MLQFLKSLARVEHESEKVNLIFNYILYGLLAFLQLFILMNFLIIINLIFLYTFYFLSALFSTT